MENQQDRIDTEARELGYSMRAVEGPGRALIVGITCEGAMPLIEDFEPSIAEAPGRTILDLPSIALDASVAEEPRGARLAALLATNLGYEARELVKMRSEFAGGGSPRSPFFLAPLLKPVGWRARVGFVPGVREILLSDLRRYLERRAREGVIIRREVRQGLVLAEEFFPLWACQRIGSAIEIVETRREVNEAGS